MNKHLEMLTSPKNFCPLQTMSIARLLAATFQIQVCQTFAF